MSDILLFYTSDNEFLFSFLARKRMLKSAWDLHGSEQLQKIWRV